MKNYIFFLTLILLFWGCGEKTIKTYEVQEVCLTLENEYENPYVDVEAWITLEGPGIQKKIYGFWDGDKTYKFRWVATTAGQWRWESHAQTPDAGLVGKKGSAMAEEWSEEERLQNPNRRGFLTTAPSGRSYQYADGTDFFMLADTWWSAATWRFPLKGHTPAAQYQPKEGISFEQAVQFRKNQEFNTVGIIAAFPNWRADQYPAASSDQEGTAIRQAWEKNGQNTGKDMHDEHGNMPFELRKNSDVIADFDRIVPAYFQSLDAKIDYLSEEGFVTFLETVRRDHGPIWKKNHDFNASFSRYVQYIIARYGAYNIIFSGIHLDFIIEKYSLSEQEFNQALTYHFDKYGPLPYGQPHTILIDGSTYKRFGHGDQAPWLTMHSVGNVPRNHGFYPMIEEIYHLDHPYPVANLEPYYPGWNHDYHNRVAGELPEPNSERDHYFGRTQMYGSVFSGALVGHMYGTGAYCGSTSGEPYEEGARPFIWEGLNYSSGAQMQFLKKFITSEGDQYQYCVPKKELLLPHKANNAQENGLDGWAFMLLHPTQELAFSYFENLAEIPTVQGLKNNEKYQLQWFNPITGEWIKTSKTYESDGSGQLPLSAFPDGKPIAQQDWCLKIVKA
ncbi:DUF5060 domain-containing protein [Persicobacter diffluens]|uniref:DUF4038 domain-containing protein n=1 Tax=Persicobacter diffluens TaxID=981 RepID=A0AAN4W3C0_9BACT|nr:hypothetical protein PEDI_49090 [Persicobacter diffluens]